MKILWVKAGKLLPPDTGGRLRSYNILRCLAAEHCVTLLSYYGGVRDKRYEEEIQKELPGAETIYTAARDASRFDQTIDYLRRLNQPTPHAVSKFTDPRVARVVEEYDRAHTFDVAICDFLSASRNFPQTPQTPAVLFQHNVESSLWRRIAAAEKNPVKRLAFQLESRKMARYEKETLRRFRQVIAVSENDRDLMLKMDPACRITLVPTGVDTRKFQPAPPSKNDYMRLVFIGSMDWEPNIDAVDYFCREIFPQVRKKWPAAVFQIVGRNPHPKVQKLASDAVTVTGSVPSINPYLSDATVVVVPLRIGGGTRLKIFEAMAMAKAIVSTTVGAEGLDVANGHDLIVADDPPTFAQAILSLLADDNVRRKYEMAALQVAARHDWSHISRLFAHSLRQSTEEHIRVAQGMSGAVQFST